MNLDLFWERIFSEEAPDVRAAWEALEPEEQESVRQLLREIAADEGRVIEQRRAAGFALEIVGAARTDARVVALARLTLAEQRLAQLEAEAKELRGLVDASRGYLAVAR